MTTEFLERIEAFLDGEISREELQQLADTEGITDLEPAIEWFRNSRIAIEAAGLRSQLQEVLPQVEKREAKVRSLRPVRLALAVAASLLVLVVAYFGLVVDRPSYLYAEYEYIDPGLPVLMSQSEDHLLYDAMTYFGEENYAVSEKKLRQIQDQYADSDTLSYYLGASLLYQGKTEEARSVIQEVAVEQNSSFRQRAQWLLVLTALRERDAEAAQSALQPILAEPGHPFLEEAKRLQSELD